MAEERGHKRAALNGKVLELMPDLQATMLAAISAAMDSGLNRMSAKVEEQFEEFDKNIQLQFTAQQAQISALSDRFQAASSTTRELTTTIQRLDDTLAAVESQVPIRIAAEGFERAIDTTIVRARTGDKISKAGLLAALQETADEMRLPAGQMVIDGAEIDKRFTIRFNGNANLAAARAAKFLQLQKTGATWRDVGVADVDGKRQRVFLDGDKNPKQTRREILTKKLANVLHELYPQAELFANRRQGEVKIGWVALARLADLTQDSYRIEWNLPEAAKANIDKETVLQRLTERDRKPGADIEWG